MERQDNNKVMALGEEFRLGSDWTDLGSEGGRE